MKTLQNLLVIPGLCWAAFSFDSGRQYGAPAPDLNRDKTVNPDSGLVACFTFDENDNDTFHNCASQDQSGIIIGADITTGVSGNGIYFDGKDDYLEIDDENIEWIDTLQTGTISFWFKVDSVPVSNWVYPVLFFTSQEVEEHDTLDYSVPNITVEMGHGLIHPYSKSVYYTVYTDSSGRPGFCVDTGHHRGHSVSAGTWHQMVVVVGRDFNKVYYDGMEQSQCSYNVRSYSRQSYFLNKVDIHSLIIGRSSWFGQEVYFNGYMDEIKIYNRVRSAREIQDEFNRLSR